MTGTLLTLYYKPTPDTAFDSVKYITSVVEFGWLIRSVHHWAANLMIICLVLHVVRIFVQGAYKYPRELTWIMGIGLLAATIGFGFTGYLLPWDQRAFWASVVGTEIAGGVPVIGPALLELLRGGADVTEATLSRFFGMHVLVLPLLLGAFLVAHLTIVHQLGLASPEAPDSQARGRVAGGRRSRPSDSSRSSRTTSSTRSSPGRRCWRCWSSSPPSCRPASRRRRTRSRRRPTSSPSGTSSRSTSSSRSSRVTSGSWRRSSGIALLGLLPFLDRNPEVRARKRPLVLFMGAVVAVAVVGLSVWGYYS